MGRSILNYNLKKITEVDYLDKYSLEFDDGRVHTVKGEEIIKIIHYSWKNWKEIKAAEVPAYLEMKSAKKKLYTLLPDSIAISAKTYVIHPYLLGVLIGDGSLTGTNIRITSADDELIGNCKEVLNSDLEIIKIKNNKYDYYLRLKIEGGIRTNYRNKYKIELKRLGLNVLSKQKFIPEEYKNGSIEQRLMLLRGLMDTDGSIDLRGHATYSTTSKQLSEDIIGLVNSLGGKCSVRIAPNNLTYKGITRSYNVSYVIGVMINNIGNIFMLKRKRDRALLRKRDSNIKLRIINIKKISNECIPIKNF
jgi:replicative DNA helicase